MKTLKPEKPFKTLSVSFSLCAAALFLSGCGLPPVPVNQETNLAILQRDISKCKQEVSRLSFRVEELNRVLETHDQALMDPDSLPEPKPLPHAPPPQKNRISQAVPKQAALYQQAFAAFSKKKFSLATEEFSSFLEKYPACDLSDNSMYWLGEISYFQKDFHKAIDIFKDLTETYPYGNKRPDALLKIGYSYLNLRDKGKAREYLTRLLKTYPFSPAGSKAEKKLERLN